MIIDFFNYNNYVEGFQYYHFRDMQFLIAWKVSYNTVSHNSLEVI